MDTSRTVNTIIVDDHPVVLDGLKSLLDDIADIKVIKESANGKEAILFLENNLVNLMIADINMPEMDGIELTIWVKKQCPDTKVILLTAYNEKEILKRALFSGAEGCLLKNTSKKELLNAIFKVLDHGYYFCDNLLEIARNLNQEPVPAIEGSVSISSRELEVMEWLLQGCSNKEVADKLNISYHTVTTHRRSIMKKTGSKNIFGLYSYSRKNNLFPLLLEEK